MFVNHLTCKGNKHLALRPTKPDQAPSRVSSCRQQQWHHPGGGSSHCLHCHHGPLWPGFHRLCRSLLPLTGQPQDRPAVPGAQRAGRVCPLAGPAGPQRGPFFNTRHPLRLSLCLPTGPGELWSFRLNALPMTLSWLDLEDSLCSLCRRLGFTTAECGGKRL